MGPKIGFSGNYEFTHLRNGMVVDEWLDSNLVPTEGLNFALNLLFQAGTAKPVGWYIGLGTGTYTPAATDTGVTLPTLVTESTAYSGGVRPAVTVAVASAGAVTNAASKATFTFTSGVTVTNAFVVTTSTGATGTALSSLAVSPSRNMLTGDQLVVTFTLTATSV